MKQASRKVDGILLGLTLVGALCAPCSSRGQVRRSPAPSLGSHVSAGRPRPAGHKRGPEESYARLPMTFEANEGQTDRQVCFLSRAGSFTLFLTKSEAVLALVPKDAVRAQAQLIGSRHQSLAPSVVRLKLSGANEHVRVVGLDALTAKSNYFLGSDPKKWRAKVSNFARVKYEGVYPGVDLVYYGNQGQLEYDFVVAPSADPGKIVLELSENSSHKGGGVKTRSLLRLAPNGDLIVAARDGELRLHKPTIYQATVQHSAQETSTPQPAGSRIYIDGHFVLREGNRVGFEVAEYDRTKPLVIDPAITYSSYLGGTTGTQFAVKTFTDAATGRVYAYVAGQTVDPDFPVVNARQASSAGFAEAFVTKFDPSASGAASVAWSTFLGGSSTDYASGIAVDSSGNAYVAGVTSSPNFPLVNAYQTVLKSGPLCPQCIFGAQDGFLAKLSADGSSLLYSTYFGGSGGDEIKALALDSLGRAYVAGGTPSPDLPTVNPYQGALVGMVAAFLAIFDTTRSGSSSLLYSTYLGGSDNLDAAEAIALDAMGTVHLVGETSAPQFPIVNGFQSTLGGYGTPFYARLNPGLAGSAQLLYSTLLPGGPVRSVAVDASGSAYMVGALGSVVGVMKIDPAKVGAAWIVYSFALSDNNGVFDASRSAIAVDSSGNAFLAMGGAFPGLPLVNPVFSSGSGVFQSLDSGQTWAGLTRGLTDVAIRALAVDTSTSPRTLYAGTRWGTIFESADGGLNWSQVFITSSLSGMCSVWDDSSPGCVLALAVNPTTPSMVYAGTGGAGVFRSTDRGATWNAFDAGMTNGVGTDVRDLVFDGGTLYAGTADGLYKLGPGATSWTQTSLTVSVRDLLVDSTTSPHTFYATDELSGTFRSTDGGITWSAVPMPLTIQAFSIALDTQTTPAAIYLIDWNNSFLYKSTDGGSRWFVIPGVALAAADPLTGKIVVDETSTPATVYVNDLFIGLSKSTDGGNTWLSTTGRFSIGAFALDTSTASATSPSTLYAAAGSRRPNAYIAEINPTGTALLFSTYLGGILGDTFATGIALDSSDNIYVTGTTYSSYLPTVNGYLSSDHCNCLEVFFTKIGSQTLPLGSSGSLTTEVAVQTGTLTVTFPDITGSTTNSDPSLTVTPLSSDATANFQLSNNLGAYDISTTATFSASASNPLTLCFQALTVNDPATFNNLQLLHVVNGVAQNIATSYDFSTRTICGQVTSLSPFILVKGALDQLRDLVRIVNESDLKKGIQTSLDAKLDSAISALTAAHNHDVTSVCNQMGAFISNVQAQSGKLLTPAEVTLFVSAAKQLEASLRCSPQ